MLKLGGKEQMAKGVCKKKSTDMRTMVPDSAAYWDEKLRRMGLSMEEGRNRKLSYVGSPTDLDYVGGVVRTNTGRVRVKKSSE